jgi:hypothetical protein
LSAEASAKAGDIIPCILEPEQTDNGKKEKMDQGDGDDFMRFYKR